jgi:hypothetical protein
MRPERPNHAVPSLIALLVCVPLLGACGNIGNAPRGAKSLSEVFFPKTTPTDAAILATDEYNAENRYRGTTMLSAAPFGGQPVYLELYVDGTDDDDPGVRAASIRALGRHGDPAHASYLIDALSDEDDGVRLAAARALQRVHTPRAVASLLRAIKESEEKNADVRAAAADALGQYRLPVVVQALIAALADPRLVVNDRVSHALVVLTGQDFGLERSAWISWYNDTDDLFEAAQIYTYPVFNREKQIVEYLPFVPPPPNENSSTPVGLNPIDD